MQLIYNYENFDFLYSNNTLLLYEKIKKKNDFAAFDYWGIFFYRDFLCSVLAGRLIVHKIITNF